jgi:hypothetical protein
LFGARRYQRLEGQSGQGSSECLEKDGSLSQLVKQAMFQAFLGLSLPFENGREKMGWDIAGNINDLFRVKAANRLWLNNRGSPHIFLSLGENKIPESEDQINLSPGFNDRGNANLFLVC